MDTDATSGDKVIFGFHLFRGVYHTIANLFMFKTHGQNYLAEFTSAELAEIALEG